MGLIRDLIGNFAQARAQEAKQKAEDQAQLADIYKFVYQNSPDPQQQQRALQDWMGILGKHGPEGKQLAEQLTPVLTGQAAVRNAKRMAQDGGMLPNYAGMTQREPAIPMAQTGQFQLPGQQTADWMSTPPASPVDAGQQAATAAAQKVYEQVGVRTASAAGARHGAREGARGFLRTLAHGAEGVGENLMGMPRAQRSGGIDPNIQIPTAEQMQERQFQGQRTLQEQRRKEGIAMGLTGDVLKRYVLTGSLPPTFGEPERAGATTAAKETEFKIPANATGDWAPYAGKNVRLWVDPKNPREVWNAAGRKVTLPEGADLAEPEKKLTKYEDDVQLWLALKAKEVGKDVKDLTKEEIYDAKTRGPLGTLGESLYDPDKAPKPGVAGQRNEEALRGQPQGIVTIVKGLADYSYQMPTGFSLANPKGPFIKALEVMKAYDPSFDASTYPMRMAVKKSYTSGQDWQNLKRINTLIGHLGRMQKSGAALGNIPSDKYGIATGTANWLRTMTMQGRQDPRLTTFNDDANAVESELAAVFKGTGAASVEEIKAWRDKVNASSSPEEIQAHIKEGVALMMSRLGILKSGYESHMGMPFNIQFLDPENAALLQRLTGGGGTGETGGTVKMRAPNGDTQDVPADQVEHFKSLGATVVK